MPRPRKKKTKAADESVEVNIAHWDEIVYNVQHRVAYCDKETFCAFSKKVYGRDLDVGILGDACCCWELDPTEGIAVIQYWFDSESETSVAPSVVAHEVVHGVDFVFRNRNLHTGFKSTEARAYLTGALMKIIPQLLMNLGAKWVEVKHD